MSDGLAPARGILVASAIGLGCWALVIWMVLR